MIDAQEAEWAQAREARKAHRKEHIWEPYQAATPPPPGEFDYRCVGCGEQQRTMRVLGNCHYCGQRELLTRDHIVPRARGGVDESWNVVLACEKDNLAKSHDHPECPCSSCKSAVVQHLMMIETIRHYSPRWADALRSIYEHGPSASRTGMPTPSRFYASVDSLKA